MGFAILDLVIGMIFIFFLLSIICSSAVELCLSLGKARARLLEEWLKKIFNSQALDSQGHPLTDKKNNPVTVGQSIMDHCMATVLSSKGRSTAYIDAKDFVSALLDKITLAPSAGGSFQLPPSTLTNYIASIQASTVVSGELKRTILMLANEATQAASVAANSAVRSELDEFRLRLEQWYDSNASRLSGTLKRRIVLPLTIVLSILISVGLNADSIAISKYLYHHKEVARSIADKATITLGSYEERIKEMRTGDVSGSADSITLAQLDKNLSRVKDDINNLKNMVPEEFPLGWSKDDKAWPKHIPGWIASILAICLGAPFWFDMLNKVANLRGTGPKPASASIVK